MRASLSGHIVLALFVSSLAASPALADKPEWAGHGKPDKAAKGGYDGDRGEARGDARVNVYFGDRQRAVVREYYADSYKRGHCPPGLAKKHNGCMPPGQAKKWQLGRPLPRDGVVYDLPSRVVVSLGVPPAGHKYVRVAGDILMIAIGTRIVVDAIDDLGGM